MTTAEYDPLTLDERAALEGMERLRLAGDLDAAGLLALSDLFDKVGDAEMAAFLRYKPDDPRVPVYSDRECQWDWLANRHIREDEQHQYGRAIVPDFVFNALKCLADSRGTYLTREAAERDLGRALLEMEAKR